MNRNTQGPPDFAGFSSDSYSYIVSTLPSVFRLWSIPVAVSVLEMCCQAWIAKKKPEDWETLMWWKCLSVPGPHEKPRLSFQNNAIHGVVGLSPTGHFLEEKSLLVTLSKFSTCLIQRFPKNLKHLTQLTLEELKTHIFWHCHDLRFSFFDWVNWGTLNYQATRSAQWANNSSDKI